MLASSVSKIVPRSASRTPASLRCSRPRAIKVVSDVCDPVDRNCVLALCPPPPRASPTPPGPPSCSSASHLQPVRPSSSPALLFVDLACTAKLCERRHLLDQDPPDVLYRARVLRVVPVPAPRQSLRHRSITDVHDHVRPQQPRALAVSLGLFVTNSIRLLEDVRGAPRHPLQTGQQSPSVSKPRHGQAQTAVDASGRLAPSAPVAPPSVGIACSRRQRAALLVQFDAVRDLAQLMGTTRQCLGLIFLR
nr:uncharacterized protein LOC127298603 isoform X1 [Lolium perenne]